MAPGGSHPLDASPAENAFRPHHQDRDHQQKRDEILGSATDDRIEKPGRDAFNTPDDKPADHCAQTESSPPRIITGNTLSPTNANWLSTPSIAPHSTPPSAETTPAKAQASAK